MTARNFSAHERNVARRWWDDHGRHLVSRTINPDDVQPKVTPAGERAPAIIQQRLVDPKLPSGILNALPFDQLTETEQIRVIVCFQYAYEREQYPERRHERGESIAQRLKLDGERVTKLAVPWRGDP